MRRIILSTAFLFVLILGIFSFGVVHFAQASTILQSDLNQNGTPDSEENDVVMQLNAVLPAGEYHFNNLTITNNATLTLDGDSTSLDIFKGVKINVHNLTIVSGSHISADGKGYGLDAGPGAPATGARSGASYGGIGGAGFDDSTPAPIYGSATMPLDLGSGGNGSSQSRGGGAIRLVVSGTLQNDGRISAEGGESGSGGSIFVTANNLSGIGTFNANGGGWYCPTYCYEPGGGGRIAIYYQNSSFTGTATALGQTGSWPPAKAKNGTVGFFDTVSNTLRVEKYWRFETADSPFSFSHIVLTNGANVTAGDNINIFADDLLVDQNSILTLPGNQILNITTININNTSILTLSGSETLSINTLNINNNSEVNIIPEHILSLTIPNITLTNNGRIRADGAGYGVDMGPGAPGAGVRAGASYGGLGAAGSDNSIPSPTYGSDIAPVDFGSGGNGSSQSRGGGAIRLVVSGTLQNDGRISAEGGESGSGGSIFVTANNLSGIGTFNANGGSGYCPTFCYGPGGGGRVAIYYQNNLFTGTITANGSAGVAGVSGNGTVVIKQTNSPCTDCFSNVLFLPGLMGSRLYEEGLNCGSDITGSECGDKELWVSVSDLLQAKLSLDTQGKSINDIFTKNDTQKLDGDGNETGIIDEISVFNIYKSFIADLKKWKDDDKIIADYAFIPYDWRLSLDDIITNGVTTANNNLSYNTPQSFSESFILKKLEALQSNSKSGKVTIIAHSNGGLVAKALIQKLKDTNNPLYNKIDKVILVAVPQVGTPDAVVALLHGTELGYGFLMGKDMSRQLSENMPTIYNLLPSANYFTMPQIPFVPEKLVSFEDKPFFNAQTSKYGVYVSDETELKDYILGTDGRTKPFFNDTIHPNIGNSVLYTQAENVHQILDSWSPSPDTKDIKVIQVAGWGEETIAGLDYKTYVADILGNKEASYKIRTVVDGDGTVVVPSALWMSTAMPNVERWWVDLDKFNRNSIILRTQHRDILEISNLRNFIESQITNSIFIDPDKIVVNNTSTLISNGIRFHYTLHSPLTLGIVDIQGRYTGQDSVTRQIREEIPNVTYKQIGNVQFLSVPSDITATLEMQGYQQGNFSLDVDKQEGNKITASTSFQGIPSSISTMATMDVIPNFEVSSATLKIDQNGDGTVDKTLKATPDGITVYDVNPPELQVTFDINVKDVIFSVQDILDQHPTIFTNKTSTTLTDTGDNTTIIPFTKYKESSTKLQFSYNKIIRNGITTMVPNTNVVYNWQEKRGILTDLDTKVTIKGVEKYIFNYKKANNATIVKEKTNSGTTTITKPGFVVVTIKTEGDSIKINY